VNVQKPGPEFPGWFTTATGGRVHYVPSDRGVALCGINPVWVDPAGKDLSHYGGRPECGHCRRYNVPDYEVRRGR
jgi:hypothetical protein